VRSGEQLLRIGSFPVLEPGQDISEAGPGGVGAGPCALTNRQLTRARLQIACPLALPLRSPWTASPSWPDLVLTCLFAAVRRACRSSSSEFSPVEPGPGRGFIATGKVGHDRTRCADRCRALRRRPRLRAAGSPTAAYGRAYRFERAMDNLGAIGGPLLALALVAAFSVKPRSWSRPSCPAAQAPPFTPMSSRRPPGLLW